VISVQSKRRWSSKPSPEQRIAANRAKGKAAKEAAALAREAAVAAGAGPAEIEAVTRAASEEVMRRPLAEFPGAMGQAG
jgi:hypothetical protein